MRAYELAVRHLDTATLYQGRPSEERLGNFVKVTSNLKYTPEEEQYLAGKNLTASLEFCQQCGRCAASWPNQVDIPTLVRSHMYAFQNANLDQARFTLADTPAHAGPEVCWSCAACLAACSHTVKIKCKVHELLSFPAVALAGC